jgi:hypothetical protein
MCRSSSLPSKRSGSIARVVPLPRGFYLYANRRLVAGNAPEPVLAGEFPKYLYWEQPDDPADSGWRVFTGDETQADADEPGNFQINAVETLTDVHPQLLQVIAVGTRGAWEWDSKAGRYLPVDS